tara:strand:- start:652 stop:867 length:216 start_codon:yes stop_codon:yes gene_type:complete
MKVGDKILVKVIPNSKKNELLEDEQVLRLYLKAVPEKGKANLLLIKFFKKKGMRVEIVKGWKSREKVLLVY